MNNHFKHSCSEEDHINQPNHGGRQVWLLQRPHLPEAGYNASSDRDPARAPSQTSRVSADHEHKSQGTFPFMHFHLRFFNITARSFYCLHSFSQPDSENQTLVGLRTVFHGPPEIQMGEFCTSDEGKCH